MTCFGAEDEARTRDHKQLYRNHLEGISQNSCRKYRIFQRKTQAISKSKTPPKINL